MTSGAGVAMCSSSGGREMSNHLAELSLPLDHLTWSQDEYSDKYTLSYRLITSGGKVAVGAHEIARNLFAGRRWIHWEASSGMICLKEIWLDGDLIDHAICLQLGDISLGAPLSVHCDTISVENNEIYVRISFAMNDGSIHNMTFRSASHSRSIFADLVDFKAGGVVSSRSDALPYLNTPDFALIRSHQISESLREGQTITCGTHLSHFGVVFGLSLGDIVYVRAASEGVYVETLLRSEWGISSLLSGFLGPNRKAAILSVSGAHIRDYSILVSVGADGVLRVWDCLARTCLQQLSVMSLIDPEIASDPSQGVVMEGVCLDTAPFDLLVTTREVDPNALGLTIAVGVTIRVGRERSWNIVLLSWSPAKASLPVRAYLRPIPIPPYISSASISLEQIALSPSQIQQSHCGCDQIATLWNIDGDVIPCSYATSGLDWSNTGHIAALSSTPLHIDPHMIPYNPAESRLACLTNDKYLLEAIAGGSNRDAMIWTATGTPHNTVDMNYLSNQITSTFLQQLLAPGRFVPMDLMEVLCHDVPYELQLNRATFDQASTVMEDCLELLLDSILRVYKEMEIDLQRASGNFNGDIKREAAFSREYLEIQIRVSLTILSMCEDRKRRRLSAPGSCAVLRRTPGVNLSTRKDEQTYLRPVMPFNFAVIRPSTMGIILKLEFFSHATLSGFAHSSSAPVGSAINEIFSKLSGSLQSPEMLHFDSSLTRYVADVVMIDDKTSNWVLKAVKSLFPLGCRLTTEIGQILTKYHTSRETIQYLIQLLQYDLIWGTDNIADTSHAHHTLHGSYAATLLKEYSTLMIRERYSFIKTILFALSILLDIYDENLAHTHDVLQAVSRLMYDSFILWTTRIYFTSTNIDEKVDFKDVQYDSTIIRSFYPHRLTNTSSSSLSVWNSYWVNLISRLHLFSKNPNYSFWQNISYQACCALYQSCHNDYIAYLYLKGQYSIVTRGCAISYLLTSSFDDQSISSHLLRCHESTMMLVSQYQSHLNDVATFCGLEIDELTPELCQSVELLLSIPIIPGSQVFRDRPLSDLRLAQDAGDKNILYIQIRSWVDLQTNKIAAAPIADALYRLSERSSFRILFTSIMNTHRDSHHPVDTLISSFTSIFLNLYELYHRSNSLTLLDRSRVILPSTRSGDELTLAAAKETVEILTILSQNLRNDKSDVAEAIYHEIELERIAVWSTIFNLAIHSHQLDRALEAVTTLCTLSSLVGVSDVSHWRSCLRTLIFTACSSGNIVWLCSLPDATIGPDGRTYIDLTSEIIKEMEHLARSSDLMSLTSSTFKKISSTKSSEDLSLSSLSNFYDCVTAFMVGKKQYMDCARLQYQLVERLGSSEEISTVSVNRLKLQSRCLLISISTLWCLPPSQRFIIYEQRHATGPSLRASDKTLSSPTSVITSFKSYLTLDDLEHRYLQVQSRLSLASKGDESVGYSTDLELVRGLCEEGNYLDAINLAIHREYPSNETNSPLEVIISKLSSQCTALANLSPSSSDLHPLEEQFLSSLGCTPHPLLHINQSTDQHLWQYFVNLLHLLEDPQYGWLLHQVATKSSISLTSYRDHRLPAIISNSYCGLDSFYGKGGNNKRNRDDSIHSVGLGGPSAEEELSRSKKRRGNVDSLLRAMLSQGCLIDACQIVSKYLSSLSTETSSLPFRGVTPQQCLPLTALDQLLYACQTALELSKAQGEEEESIQLLQENYQEVRQQITRYFVELFQRELVAN